MRVFINAGHDRKYDSGASLKGKGMAFTRQRLARHLREYRRRYGADGWVLDRKSVV